MPRSRAMQPAGWRNDPCGRLHHVRLHSRDDIQRVARAFTGREIALVLSGGGARGIAHFGLFRALAELEIPIDVVGGSSFGSIASAGLAMGWTWDEQRRMFAEDFVSQGSPVDFTAPAVCARQGRQGDRGYSPRLRRHDDRESVAPLLLRVEQPVGR